MARIKSSIIRSRAFSSEVTAAIAVAPEGGTSMAALTLLGAKRHGFGGGVVATPPQSGSPPSARRPAALPFGRARRCVGLPPRAFSPAPQGGSLVRAYRPRGSGERYRLKPMIFCAVSAKPSAFTLAGGGEVQTRLSDMVVHEPCPCRARTIPDHLAQYANII